MWLQRKIPTYNFEKLINKSSCIITGFDKQCVFISDTKIFIVNRDLINYNSIPTTIIFPVFEGKI